MYFALLLIWRHHGNDVNGESWLVTWHSGWPILLAIMSLQYSSFTKKIWDCLDITLSQTQVFFFCVSADALRVRLAVDLFAKKLKSERRHSRKGDFHKGTYFRVVCSIPKGEQCKHPETEFRHWLLADFNEIHSQFDCRRTKLVICQRNYASVTSNHMPRTIFSTRTMFCLWGRMKRPKEFYDGAVLVVTSSYGPRTAWHGCTLMVWSNNLQDSTWTPCHARTGAIGFRTGICNIFSYPRGPVRCPYVSVRVPHDTLGNWHNQNLQKSHRG